MKPQACFGGYGHRERKLAIWQHEGGVGKWGWIWKEAENCSSLRCRKRCTDGGIPDGAVVVRHARQRGGNARLCVVIASATSLRLPNSLGLKLSKCSAQSVGALGRRSPEARVQ